MVLIKPGQPDGRLTDGVRRKTKVEKITEQIAILFREIRSLELELSRTDPHELVDDADQKLEP